MIKGKKRAVEKTPGINVNIETAIHNRFDIEVVDAKTGEVNQEARAYNIVLNNLWTRLQSNLKASWATNIHYGSGTATPSASDTSLTGFIASVSIDTRIDNFDADARVFSTMYSASLSETTAVGKTISEIGLAYGSSQNNLVTKALLQDMNGNPITILKTDTDIINIYATVFVRMLPEDYDNGYIQQFNGPLLGFLAGTYSSSAKKIGDGVVVSAGTNPYDGLGTFHPSGWTTAIAFSTPTFDAATKRLILGTGRATAGTGNQDGWSSLSFGIVDTRYANSQDFLFRVGGSWYPGTQITGEAIGTGDGATVDFSTKFGFVENPVIYVDGVPVSGVSVNVGELINPRDNYAGMFNSIDANGNLICRVDNNSSYANVYYENPNYETVGITELRKGDNGKDHYVSHDLIEWVRVSGSTIPAEYQHYRYWRNNQGTMFYYGVTTTDPRTTNIHFDTPPAAGAVITADYFTKTIAKDENHVFDFSLTIQLGEYTED